MPFIDRLNQTASATNNRLWQLLAEKTHLSEYLDESITYSVTDGGKRLRSYLVQEFCELCGNNSALSLDYACAIEMIHAFSLIHDDLPAMDDDDMRRGKPSNHKKFGEATAILAGDSLALDAFFVAGNNTSCSKERNLEAVLLLSKKSGSLGMCAGQQTDLDGEGKQLDTSELLKLVDLKTGALFEASCALGCIAADADFEKIEAAKQFGLLSGRAFQITDDLLDIHSTVEELGKSIGKDLDQEKSTFVSLLGEDGAKKYAEDCINGAKEALCIFPDNEAKIRLIEYCDYILIRSK